MKTCHVVGAGDFLPSLLQKNEGDLILAADAGFRLLKEAGITPQVYIGDGDSLGFVPEAETILTLPPVKDDTDTLAALRWALERGWRRFRIYGALGGKRPSHSLANLQLLSFLKDQGAQGILVDPRCTVELLKEETRKFSSHSGYFSLFATEGEAELSVSGAKYNLSHRILSPSFPLGVSNEGQGEVTVTVHRGKVLLVRED